MHYRSYGVGNGTLEGVSPITRHSEFDPQGEGLQRSFSTSLATGNSILRSQVTNGLPVNPGKQLQNGLWLTTEHWVFRPHAPGQGSIHFCFIQAIFERHSWFPVHSGRHNGGVPKYVKLGGETKSYLVQNIVIFLHSLVITKQYVYGSPVKFALMAHVPGHGSAHLLRIQVLFRGQSEFNKHSGRHSSYGSPWYSFKQEHSPSVQTAFTPHGDALPVEHSEDNMHSGRHAGGVPTNCGRQEHTACPLISRHCELGPQGDGWHELIADNKHLLMSSSCGMRLQVVNGSPENP
uniref:Uncharacterized protein n=1 Tax=Glossina austeni TaxID=7395 RepID=A0A1A9VW34_GLOAU